MGNEQGNQDEKGKQYNPENEDNQGETTKPENVVVCPTKICEDITSVVPVEVHSYANIGNIVIKCMGSNVVKEKENSKNVSKFEVVQKVFTQIPIDFVTKVDVKNERVDFNVYECK